MAEFGDTENAGHDYAAGVAAGISTVLVGHPFDTIKVKLQTELGRARGPQNWRALRCSAQLLRTEGVKGFYRGATPSFVGMSVESSVLFGSYSQLKALFQSGEKDAALLSTVLPAAALAGASVSSILCPAELVKCRLQVHAKGSAAGAQQYAGPLDCIRQTVRAEGVPGLFRGLTATFLRETVGNCCFWVTYEATRRHMRRTVGLEEMTTGGGAESQPESFSRPSLTTYFLEAGVGIFSGGLAGIAFWTVILPLDVAKTRVQTAQDLSTSRSPIFHLRTIYRDLGIRGLYAGLGPTLVRAFPANAAAICAWEATARLLAST